ncbi:response regulator [Bacillus sp. 1P06AnD]|uniref:response regulator n=1 Tax=Bacillus sp. 1P06AnD TaxID=3132208 RepID=UPI0039A2484C
MWKIIIVEDEIPTLNLMKHLFEIHGQFQVIAAYPSPKAALKELPGKDCDAIICDIELPGMNGIEFMKSLNREGNTVPVIFSTAFSQYALDAFSVYAIDYLLKPLTPRAVQQVNERLEKYYRHNQRTIEGKQVHIQIFGNPSVLLRNKHMVKWPTKVTEELFYYFVLHNGFYCSKWSIIDSIWPEMDEKRALANLYNTIYRLRNLFQNEGDSLILESGNEGYRLILSKQVYIDYFHWKTLMKAFGEKKDAQIGKELHSIYKGPLLDLKGYLWAIPFQLETEKEIELNSCYMESSF